MSRASALHRVAPATAAAAATTAVLLAVRRWPTPPADAPVPTRPTRWRRANYRGHGVTLAGGPAVVAGLAAGLGVAAATRPRGAALAPFAATGLAVTAAAAAGWYDDARSVLAAEQRTKGLRGHAAAALRGRLSAGAVKMLATGGGALGAALIVAGAAQPRPSAARIAADATAIAGTAHLVNLLDLRPGRALKATLGLATALAPAALRRPPHRTVGAAVAPLLASTAATAVAALPADLHEETMLGDLGAGALGAGIGAAAVVGCRPRTRLALAGVSTVLALAAERVSFSAVIEAVPPLRAVDRWGRAEPAA